MRTRTLSVVALSVAFSAGPRVAAQETPLPPPDRTPILVLDHPGPHAPVAALAFAPARGAGANAIPPTLYVGGQDKLVRRYVPKDGKFSPIDPLRVPLGNGNAGAINAVAVSPDGRWVAVAGRAPLRGEVWSGQDDGIVTDTRTLPPLLKRDFGVVYLFDRDNPNGGGRVVRGAESEVRALAFANPAPAGGHVLVTAGAEWDDTGKRGGVVRAFNVNDGKQLGEPVTGLPGTPNPPGLAAWATGADKTGLRVAVAWGTGNPKDGSELVVWDGPGTKPTRTAEAGLILHGPLATRVGPGGAAEILTAGFHPALRTGQLRVRAADPVGAERALPVAGAAGQFLLPVAIAPLTVNNADATAVLVRVAPKPADSPFPTELRVLDAKGNVIGGVVKLPGLPDDSTPVLSASPDGRFVAVGGFTNHRVEVYDVAAHVANREAKQQIDGAAGGFDRVAFLVGNKVWLGGAADSTAKGGIVFDHATRAATANDGKAAVDAPAGVATFAPDAANRQSRVVTYVLGGAAKTITLTEGLRWTVAVVHPGKPAWDPDLGPFVAVAHTDDDNAVTLVTVFDAVTGKPRLQLNGPAQPIRSLAFSGTKPLIAAAGADRAVSVWTLRDLRRELPAVEGVTVVARGEEVAVASVEATSPANGKLAPGDIVEKVGGAKGELKAVKTPLDFVLAVRALKIKDDARIQVKGKAAAVVVPVGVSVGHRHPLVRLWVDPVAKDGLVKGKEGDPDREVKIHDWVGWTAAGPYDANSAAAEARIGWLTATGKPENPATFAAAKEYRGLYLKKDFLRFLFDEAEFDAALRRYVSERPAKPAALVASLVGPVDKRDGKIVTRAKAAELDVSLLDPDQLLVLDGAVLRWRPVAPDGTEGPPQDVPIAGGRTKIDLAAHAWPRGENQFRLSLHRTPKEPAAVELTAAFTYLPPAPALTVAIDGKPVAPGAEVTTKLAEVTLAPAVTAPGGPADVTVTTSAPDGDKPLSLVADAAGKFEPVKVKIAAEGKTVIRATAKSRGAADAEAESHAVEVSVRRLPPDPVPPPEISLKLLTPHDPRPGPTAPYGTTSPRATVAAAVSGETELESFEWDLGDGKWVPGKLDPKTRTESREVALPIDGTPLAVRVRAKVKNSSFAEDGLRVVYTALPDAAVSRPPLTVTGSELELTGPIEAFGQVPYTAVVVVTSARTGKSREFAAVPDQKNRSWKSVVSLTPGDNQIGLVLRNTWREARKPGLAEVAYLRPPVVVEAPPADAGTGVVADVVVVTATPTAVAPTELLVNDAAVPFRAEGKAVALFGVSWWKLKAEGVSVKDGAGRAKAVRVVVRNAEGPSAARAVEVRGMDPVPVPPPAIVLTRAGRLISPGGEVSTDEARFTFDLSVVSEKPLTRLELWHGDGVSPREERVAGVGVENAVAAGAGQTANVRQTVVLRPGINRFRVAAAHAGDGDAVSFKVTCTLPPVRVVIDSISEPAPGGKLVALPVPLDGAPVQAAGPVVEVRGRIVWDADDAPVSRDPNLAIVLHANLVAHLPVRPSPADAVKREREFVAPVFLNGVGGDGKLNRIRVELRSGGRIGAIPQQGVRPAEFQVHSTNPNPKQRLHVLVIGVDVPERDRVALAKRIVEAVNGSVPENRPGFDRGDFNHPRFSRAVLYRPLLADVDRSDMVGILKEVEREIEQTAARDEKWVNDIVVTYYRGKDLVGKDDGLHRLHTSRSLVYPEGPAATFAVRVDELPPTPGALFPLLNIVDPTGKPLPQDTPRAGAEMVRVVWANGLAAARLPDLLEAGVRQAVRLEGVLGRALAEASKTPGIVGTPTAQLPPEVLARLIGKDVKP